MGEWRLTPKSYYKVVTRYNKLIETDILTERQEQIFKLWLEEGLTIREITDANIIKGKQGFVTDDTIRSEIKAVFGDIIDYLKPTGGDKRRCKRTNEEMLQHQRLRRKLITNNPNACCVVCGSKDNLQLDHIITYVIGGTTDESNVQVLCKSCHRKKTEQERQQLGWDKPLRQRYKSVTKSNREANE